MKRPQGFDRPPARRPAVPETAPSADRPERVVLRRGGGAVPASAGSPSAGAKKVAPDAEPVAAIAGAERRTTAARPASERRPDPQAADRAAAAAARARKRFERQEVRRFTRRSRRRRLAWLAGVGAIVLVIGGSVAAAYSPLMALRVVQVEGASKVPASSIQAAFAAELGTPLALISSTDVRDALAGFPLIETYSTQTIPPSTLVVRIVERTPVGVVDTGHGLELVDAAGVVIDRPATRPADQPIIAAPGGVASEGFRAAGQVIRSLPAAVRQQVVTASAETPDDVQLGLKGGAKVMWGSADDSALKATVLTELMRAAPPGTVSRYDVSAPTSPVTG